MFVIFESDVLEHPFWNQIGAASKLVYVGLRLLQNRFTRWSDGDDRRGWEHVLDHQAGRGVAAELLFLLEAPGAKAVGSGFVSRNNPDQTARNWCRLLQQAGIPRRASVLWNIVPWYLGTGSRIRGATAADIRAGLRTLPALLQLLPRLRAVVLVGGSAQRAHAQIAQMVQVPILHVPHPSPQFINRTLRNRQRLLAALRKVKHSIHG